MEEYLIDNIISPEAEKQLSSLSKTITELASNIESLNNIPKATKDNSSNKEFDLSKDQVALIKSCITKLDQEKKIQFQELETFLKFIK